MYVTERAVFEMRDGALTLTEIAPGVDLQRDILDQCSTAIVIAPDLRQMDARLFQSGNLSQNDYLVSHDAPPS